MFVFFSKTGSFAKPETLARCSLGNPNCSDNERGYLGHFEPIIKKVEEWKSPGQVGWKP
jgi:hypothetical protein